MLLGHQRIASHFGYKLFKAETLDDLTLLQYNTLVELWNSGIEQSKPKDGRTTSIVTVPGKDGVNYGED